MRGRVKNQEFPHRKVELLLEFLPKDKDSAVTQNFISDYMGIPKRNIRQLVQQARNEGYAICSTPYDGYWYSESPDDIESTINILEAHKSTIQQTIDSLRKAKEECIVKKVLMD